MRRTVMIRRLTVLAVTVLAMLAFASPAWADTFTVDRTDDPIPVAGAGACTAAANDCSLRGAIEKSNATGQADTIEFSASFFAGPHTITLQDALTTGNDAADDLTINGPGQSLLTVKQSAAVRAFQIVGKTTINGITISGGRSPNNAGGILNNGGANLTLNDTTVTDNEALGAFPNGDGGGIYNASDATVTLNRSTVSGNKGTGDNGGGIYNSGGTLTLNNSTLSGNQGNTAGGGIHSYTNLTGTQKTTVTNSTISGNHANWRGGGIFNQEGLTAIEHSTITNNTATLAGQGGGVASVGNTATRTEVLSTIVSANSNTDDVDFVNGATNSFVSKGFNLLGDGNATGAFNKTGDQTLVMVPGLETLALNGGATETHALQTGSPAIDAGPSSCPATDQRGVTRPQGPRCDIGAFEAATPTVSSTTPTNGVTGVPRNISPTATFSEEMDPATLTASTAKVYQRVRKNIRRHGKVRRVWRWVPVSAEVSYDTVNKTVTLNPYGTSETLLAPSRRHLVVISTGAKDKAGNALAQNYSWTFTTGIS